MLATRRSAQLQDVVQLLMLVDSARSTALMGSARSAIAPLPPDQSKKETATGIAGTATRKCARRKVALHLRKHVVSVESMVLKDSANLLAAPPTLSIVDLHIATFTAVERRSRAPWRAAPPPLPPEASARNMAVVQVNAGSQAAPTSWSAGSRPAGRTVERVTAQFQIAGQLQASLVATVSSIPASSRTSLYFQFFYYTSKLIETI